MLDVASKNDIREWLMSDKAKQADYMLSICDTFSFDDYPVFVKRVELSGAIENYSKNMQKVMEVYDLHGDIEAQLDEERAWHTA